MTNPSQDHPDVSIHPPTVFFSGLIIGFILRAFIGGWLPLPRIFAEAVGGLTMLVSLSVVIASITAFAESGETLRPATPSHQLFTDGIYQRSRNPIYLAMVLFGIGFGIATLNIWIVGTSLLTGVVLNFLVIPQEELYLTRRFGADYEDYCHKVRRWL